MPFYEAILFDFDGVLIDSEPVHFECWREVLRPHGVELDWPSYEAHAIGIADRRMIEMFAELADPPADPDVLWAEYPAKQKLFRERILDRNAVPLDVPDLLSSLYNYRLGVVTSSGRSEVEPILQHYNLLPCFAATIYREDVTRHKPAPDPYRKAASQLGARTALVVEDSDPGLESGKAAGFDVLRITNAAHTATSVRKHLAL